MNKYVYGPEELSFVERNCVPYAVFQFLDERVVTVAVTSGFAELFGYDDTSSACKLMDTDMYRDVHPDDSSRLADIAVCFALGDEGEEYDTVFRAKIRGEYRIIHAFGRHIYPEPGLRLAVIWFSDEGVYGESGEVNPHSLNLEYRSMLNRGSIYHEMNYDFLTGLPSMTYFFRLADAGRRLMNEKGLETALVYADISGLKYFNKKYGFAEGNKIITGFAKILAGYFGNENCSRFGQDHFAFYYKAEGLEAVLDSVIEDCGRINGGNTLPVRFGIYLDPTGNTEVSIACDRAKYACNSHRDDNRSYYIRFDDSMLEMELRRQYILDNLDLAISENWIRAYYQPIVRAANIKVCDEEALARWIDPDKGLISPADFIPILEDAKLIYRVDLHMVDLVLARMLEQKAAGQPIVPVSVNLSRTDFETCDIVDEICRRVDDAGIGRDKLTIEITESVVGDDFEYMKARIERFRELGFRVWMDDFGSGYSSLDVLQDINFDLIKFDMRFMRQLDKGQNAKIIMTELLKMAAGLGIETVAEGVEKEEQVEFLKEIGCTKLQGFHFSRPVTYEGSKDIYRKDIEIGFEDPKESDYYTSLGKVNLYDLSIVAGEGSGKFKDYFDTVPMSVIESNGDSINVVRCNRSYRKFVGRYFNEIELGTRLRLQKDYSEYGADFLDRLKKCAKERLNTFVDEPMYDGSTVHAFIRHIADNPVSGISACAVVVLGITGTTAAKA
ncbi:MAG: GGDEF domain-containing phosphodiesterase [Lachnospiraceae bacterium]|nr:GGDEF domain-containing phosphodiesterase [Lachnospiraceae bacterium]